MLKTLPLFALIAVLACATAARAEEEAVMSVKNHVVAPQQVVVPAGQKVKLTIRNQDLTKMRFRSNALDHNETIDPNDETTFTVGPLQPGTYTFTDADHPEVSGSVTAQ